MQAVPMGWSQCSHHCRGVLVADLTLQQEMQNADRGIDVSGYSIQQCRSWLPM